MDTVEEFGEMFHPCQVCKTTEPGRTMLLVPNTDGPTAIVFIHIKCMGGLPLIALKWTVTTISDKPEIGEEQPTLLDFLSAWPSELLDFGEGGE